MSERRQLADAKRIVVKVGTSTVTYETGRLNLSRIESIARELADLANSGKEIVLVTSGAIGAGVARLGLKEKPKTIPMKQAAAAVGQGLLMHIYEKVFSEYDRIVAQVLLTREDSVDRERFVNSRNAFSALLDMGVIPIVNENDAVAVDELNKIGQNDTLSAVVASLVDADLLIILTDIEGLYTADPRSHPDAVLIPEVREIDESIEAISGGAGTDRGTGGMRAKIQAAKIATASGVPMVIASADVPNAVRRIVAGESIGTVFLPRENALHFKKRWLAFGARVTGSVVVDEGCEASIRTGGASLLAAGIRKVEGRFLKGEIVSIVTASGREIARGIANYGSDETAMIMGCRTDDIERILGAKPYDEVIHRDNLASLV
jgi:glutamate 5-kinase